MWFPTTGKVVSAFDELRAEFGRLDKRIEVYEQQVDLFGATLDRDGTFRSQIEELRELYWLAQGDFLEASIALTMGQRSPRSAAKAIKPTKAYARQLSTAIDYIDAASEVGKAAFRDRFGTK